MLAAPVKLQNLLSRGGYVNGRGDDLGIRDEAKGHAVKQRVGLDESAGMLAGRLRRLRRLLSGRRRVRRRITRASRLSRASGGRGDGEGNE